MAGDVRLPENRDTFGLSTPEAPTRASGFHKVNLSEWAKRTHPRLSSRKDARPFQGRAPRLPDGSLGGSPCSPLPLNFAVAAEPMVRIPGALARRVEVLRREHRRKRIDKAAPSVFLSPGISGLDVAQSWRHRPGTPSGFRGVLRDMRGIRSHATAPDGQIIAPSIVSDRMLAIRQRTVGTRTNLSTVAPARVDLGAQEDHKSAMGQALGTASSTATKTSTQDGNEILGLQMSTALGLAAVVAVAFILFRR